MWVTSMPQVWDDEGTTKGGGGSVVTPAPAAVLLGSLAGWLSCTVQPPAPRVCGTDGGPPVTAPWVRLLDGRHLSYCESGVPRDKARFKVVFSHRFTGSHEDSVRASQVRVGSFWSWSYQAQHRGRRRRDVVVRKEDDDDRDSEAHRGDEVEVERWPDVMEAVPAAAAATDMAIGGDDRGDEQGIQFHEFHA